MKAVIQKDEMTSSNIDQVIHRAETGRARAGRQDRAGLRGEERSSRQGKASQCGGVRADQDVNEVTTNEGAVNDEGEADENAGESGTLNNQIRYVISFKSRCDR
jgi:hypothetical protein